MGPPDDGLIEPDEFIPLLEQPGQIDQIGRWVLQQACRQMSAWHAAGDTLDVSVNVSSRQLDHDAIVEDIRQALVDSGLPPAFLIIEITETALMVDAAATAVRLRAIRELGVRIAVDDFGTGYSSLPICNSSRSTRSRSTADSPTRSARHPNRERSSGPSCNSNSGGQGDRTP